MNVSPLLAPTGRRPAWRTASSPSHYGDPLREQRLLAEGAGLVDRSDRDVVAVPGADRLTWLHSLTSQHLDAARPTRTRQRGAGAVAERARRAPPRPRRPGRHHLGRRRARHRRGAGRRSCRGCGSCSGWSPALVTDEWARAVARRARRPTRCWPRPGSRCRTAVRGAALDGGFVRRMPADRRRRRDRCSTSSCRAPSSPAVGGPAAVPPLGRASPPTRRCGWRPGGRGSAWTATTGPSRTSCSGCRPPSTWTRAATAARRRWPGCTTWAGRRGGWCCCTSTA